MIGLSGPTVDRYTPLAALAVTGVLLFIILRPRPQVVIACWVGVLCFVPVWLGVSVSVYMMPAVALALGAVLLILPVRGVRVGLVDVAVVFFVLTALLPVVTGGATRTTVFVLLVQWMVPFLLGRLIVPKIGADAVYRVVATCFSAVSVVAILEFLLRWNPFILLRRDSAMFTALSRLQERGGIVRAEAAFGHSIALGASVALAIPLTLASSFPLRIRAAMIGTMLGATVVTFSRIGMICAALSLTLSIIFLKDRLTSRVRYTLLGTMVALGAVVLPLVTQTFNAAGSEATDSAAYRGNLLSLLPDIALTGFSSGAHRTPTGEIYFGRFQSIDSALMVLGLTYGWLTLIIAALVLIGAVVAVLTRRGTPAAIAVVAQIPALAAVALITQYATFFWFTAGLAVASQLAQPRNGEKRGTGSDQVRVSRTLGYQDRALSEEPQGRVG